MLKGFFRLLTVPEVKEPGFITKFGDWYKDNLVLGITATVVVVVVIAIPILFVKKQNKKKTRKRK